MTKLMSPACVSVELMLVAPLMASASQNPLPMSSTVCAPGSHPTVYVSAPSTASHETVTLFWPLLQPSNVAAGLVGAASVDAVAGSCTTTSGRALSTATNSAQRNLGRESMWTQS